MNHKKIEVYAGTHLGVNYEIRHWCFSNGMPVWNFYILFIEDQFPDIFDSLWKLRGEKVKIGNKETKHIYYKYNKTIVGNMKWHGDCTFFEKVSGFDGAPKVVKAGCDYAHLFDEDHRYTLADVELEVIDCIEDLVSRTTVLQRCMYCGEWTKEVDQRQYCQKCANEH